MLRESEYAVYPPSIESHIDINIGLSTETYPFTGVQSDR